jgi:hypothetical protein
MERVIDEGGAASTYMAADPPVNLKYIFSLTPLFIFFTSYCIRIGD